MTQTAAMPIKKMPKRHLSSTTASTRSAGPTAAAKAGVEQKQRGMVGVVEERKVKKDEKKTVTSKKFIEDFDLEQNVEPDDDFDLDDEHELD
ncbi:hypothetical protein XA68_12834 [Ophiocordyceps unilateralis]|uniref:Uncharacterized protein n=1 Tax=Ophiocordyceps unilateralis TaxID=268505 RepID=A0A2A9PCC3_OPHUN|nr:hypothetical protein XA68_12834 [Ophiocordyceps unilateralis]